jgi:hypothetical protein
MHISTAGRLKVDVLAREFGSSVPAGGPVDLPAGDLPLPGGLNGSWWDRAVASSDN